MGGFPRKRMDLFLCNFTGLGLHRKLRMRDSLRKRWGLPVGQAVAYSLERSAPSASVRPTTFAKRAHRASTAFASANMAQLQMAIARHHSQRRSRQRHSQRRSQRPNLRRHAEIRLAGTTYGQCVAPRTKQICPNAAKRLGLADAFSTRRKSFVAGPGNGGASRKEGQRTYGKMGIPASGKRAHALP